jgi:hypothetical protein
VNDGLQIYVIYFLIVFKMKKIILLFFTFLGICSCFSQDTLKTGLVKDKPSVHIYPNPAKNKAEVEIKGFEPGFVKIQLMNTSGKLLREEKRLVLTGNEFIMFMFSEKPGLYFLFLKQDKIILKNKLVIQ